MLPEEGTLTLGRAPDASIRIEDSSVSRLHARLHVGGVVRVEDLGSANGTRIGGTRLRAEQPTPIPAGQVVEIGSSWMMIANAPLSGSTTRQEDASPEPRGAPGASWRTRTIWWSSTRRCATSTASSSAPRSPTSACCCSARRASARRCSRAGSTRCSPRADKPFVGLNCAALARVAARERAVRPREGRVHRRRRRRKPGLLETADGRNGVPRRGRRDAAAVQVKLLRVLEERQVLRVGGTRPRPDRRARPLRDEPQSRGRGRVAARSGGSVLPAQRHRDRDPAAARAAVGDRARWRAAFVAPGGAAASTAAAGHRRGRRCDRLRSYQWPGNVRELRNVMERAVVLADGGRITTDALPADTYVGPVPAARTGSAAAPFRAPRPRRAGDDERQRILEALERCAGNQTRAAELLGISAPHARQPTEPSTPLPRPRKRETSLAAKDAPRAASVLLACQAAISRARRAATGQRRSPSPAPCARSSARSRFAADGCCQSACARANWASAVQRCSWLPSRDSDSSRETERQPRVALRELELALIELQVASAERARLLHSRPHACERARTASNWPSAIKISASLREVIATRPLSAPKTSAKIAFALRMIVSASSSRPSSCR